MRCSMGFPILQAAVILKSFYNSSEYILWQCLIHSFNSPCPVQLFNLQILFDTIHQSTLFFTYLFCFLTAGREHQRNENTVPNPHPKCEHVTAT